MVITNDGGLMQHIMADQEGTEVMVLDFDTDGADEERIKEFEGNPVYLIQGDMKIIPFSSLSACHA